MAWKGIVGERFAVEDFARYLEKVEWKLWKPQGITLHHTGVPDLEMRPNGFTPKHIQGLESYYRDVKKWQSAPHLFIDQDGIWVFTPLTLKGVHAVSFNRTHIGIEMLGNYDVEAWHPKVRSQSIESMALLCARLQITPGQINFHRNDPLTRKSCPGVHIGLATVQAQVKEQVAANIIQGQVQEAHALVIVDNKWRIAVQSVIREGRVLCRLSDLLRACGRPVTGEGTGALVSASNMAQQWGMGSRWNSAQKKLYLTS